MQRSSRIVIILMVLIVGWFAFRALTPPALPDSVQIDHALRDAAHAAEKRNISGVLRIISEHYQDDSGNNPDRIHFLLSRGMQNVNDLKVDISPTQVTVKGNTAHSTCYLTIHVNGEAVYNQFVQLDWAREDSHTFLIFPSHTWRVVHSTYAGGFGDV
jgi:hypothetical protein